jgi:hypothetical protein
MKVIFLTLIVLPILVHAGDLDDDEHKIRGGNRPEFLANCPCRLTVQVEDDAVKEWIKSHPNITVLDPIEHMPFMVIEVPNRGLAVAIIKHPGVLRVNEDASIPDGYEIKLQGNGGGEHRL